MKQKVNPIVFRLGNRRSWTSLWNVEKQNLGKLLFLDFELRFYLNIFFSFFGFFNIILFLSKSISNFSCYSKFFENSCFFNKKSFLFFKKKDYLMKKAHNLNFLSGSFSQLRLEGFANKGSLDKISSKLVSRQIKFYFNSLYMPVITAQCISRFISGQLEESFKNKELAFKKNVKQGILKMIQVCFNAKTIKYISGIKILCTGKWMKTGNGRAQFLRYSLGKVNSQRINAFLDHGTSTANTPFGSCCLNVVVCYKSIN